ncbi:hypothetical protein H5410_016441 [Solanum commersonii]|uniref:Hydrophobic seed protein domain-containing protein n=1 Tax=Solanum commersonii TaxID=4109 RepID=A0A9J5ZWH3_SOLCO|nr:hypothetical protein H5410_016441 [Solanum commersonii]
MASKTSQSSVTLFLSLNLLFFALVSGQQTCPMGLGVCANILKCVGVGVGVGVGLDVGSPETMACSSAMAGLTDQNAAFCLCTAIKAGEMGPINVSPAVAAGVILKACGRPGTTFNC